MFPKDRTLFILTLGMMILLAFVLACQTTESPRTPEPQATRVTVELFSERLTAYGRIYRLTDAERGVTCYVFADSRSGLSCVRNTP